MTNQETNTANAAVTEVSSTFGATDTTLNVTSTADFPASPCYIVVDPDSDAKREIILMDGTFTGTTLVTTTTANRYLDGSAAGSGITHDIGAKVIVASSVSQLWTDINDRVEGHTHAGGTTGTAVAHSDLTGLTTGDPHTQYTANTDTDVSGTSWVLDEDTLSSDSATKVPTQQSVKAYVDALTDPIGIACSDESTAISTTGTKATFRMPYAMTVTDVRANVNSACASGTFTVDINEAGTTILSTKLTIDATEKTSETAATAAVISDSALADDAEITIDVDNVGDSTATGLKVWIIGTRA